MQFLKPTDPTTQPTLWRTPSTPEVFPLPEVLMWPRKMAGDSAMELLFLETFKHQSAEVNLQSFPSSLVSF